MQTFSITAMLTPSTAALQKRLQQAAKYASDLSAMCSASCREGYAAAALYHDLAGLSHGELQRRGVPHGDLLRHIADSLGRP